MIERTSPVRLPSTTGIIAGALVGIGIVLWMFLFRSLLFVAGIVPASLAGGFQMPRTADENPEDAGPDHSAPGESGMAELVRLAVTESGEAV